MSNETITLNGLTEAKDTTGFPTREVFDERVLVLPQRNHLLSLMTILRDSNTSGPRFAEVTERVADQLVGAGASSHVTFLRI